MFLVSARCDEERVKKERDVERAGYLNACLSLVHDTSSYSWIRGAVPADASVTASSVWYASCSACTCKLCSEPTLLRYGRLELVRHVV